MIPEIGHIFLVTSLVLSLVGGLSAFIFKRELPIEAIYFGAKIDTIDDDKVNVVWGNNIANNVVYIEK